jgi:pyruvate kinase
MEIPSEKVFLAMKLMIAKANRLGKPVVTGTQMKSMTKSSHPTLAEATNVSIAVLHGSDCIMLRGETTAGA